MDIDFDKHAAKISRQPCPDCGSVGTMLLGQELVAKPLGTYSIAGAQTKVVAQTKYTITCEECGWKRYGKFEGRYYEGKFFEGKYFVVDKGQVAD